jgi:hypothetical protein
MDAAAAMGIAVMRRPRLARVTLAALLVTLLGNPAASAAERYAVIVTGAAGGPQYAQKYDTWRAALVATLKDRFGYPDAHIIVLADEQATGVRRSTRDQVRTVLTDLGRRATKDDVVLIFLIGHGAALEGDDAKFNLVGPDLTGAEWAALVKPIDARLIFVNGAGGSFPFLEKLAGPGRIVITANETPAQQFETVFPEFFVKALADQAADTDKNRRVSVWEAFVYASTRVKAWYEERGQLPTERPLIDDLGRGVGRDAEKGAADESLSRFTYLQPDLVLPADADAELARLHKRRSELEAAIERLRINKPSMPADQYESQLERLLLELSQLDRQIRARP